MIEENKTVPVKRNKKKKYIVIFLLLIAIISGFSIYNYLENESRFTHNDPHLFEESIFQISEYDTITELYKERIRVLFDENEYISDGSYFFTKIPSRAKKVVAYGNFSNKRETQETDTIYESDPYGDDIAFIVEKNDFRSSAIFIMASNGSVLYFYEFNGELPTIKSFKKGAKIFMGETVLTGAPCDGLLIFTESEKRVLIYVPKKDVFNMYYQYTNQDIEDQKNNEEYYEGEEEEYHNSDRETVNSTSDTLNKD